VHKEPSTSLSPKIPSSDFGWIGRSQGDARFFIVPLSVGRVWRCVSLPRRLRPSRFLPHLSSFSFVRPFSLIRHLGWIARPWFRTYHCFFCFPSTLVLANNTLVCSITCRPLPMEPNEGVFWRLTVPSSRFTINDFPSSIFLCTSPTNPGYI
jgi:hypothetical protein